MLPAAVSLAGTATTVMYYWRSFVAVSGVIDAVTVEVYHVVDAAGEEAVTWMRFAGGTARGTLVAALIGLVTWALVMMCSWMRGAPKKFSWVWPSPFAQAERSPSNDTSTADLVALESWEKSCPASKRSSRNAAPRQARGLRGRAT